MSDKDAWRKGKALTGRADCTNSLRIPPQNMHVKPVNIRAACLQNHILRASLYFKFDEDRVCEFKQCYLLVYINNEEEHCSCQEKAQETKQFIVEGQSFMKVRKSQECQKQHNSACECNKPL
jgi:hypothetical protein